MGGPGVQRSYNFVKELSKQGYSPIVLTIRESEIDAAKYQKDLSLLNKIPANIEIVRIDSGQNFALVKNLMKWRVYRLFWYFFYPLFWEKMANWPFVAFRHAKRLILENDLDLVYTSSGPFSSLILGYLLKKRLGIKWVADLRDPYTDAYAWSYPSKLHWMFSRVWEKWILSSADQLIVNTPEVKKLYLKRNILPESKINVITNGY
jgi:glycosyltransferase involved in cell wall biosynthesis